MSGNRVKNTLVRTTLVVGLAAGLAATLQGCVLALAGVAGGGALIATDRRTVGTQTEDREIQVKATSQIANTLGEDAHVNVTVFNRRVLLTGEVPNEQAKQQAATIVRGINNVNLITNELAIQPKSTMGDRANDSYLESRVKASLIAMKGISANDFKVVCERGNVYLMGLVTNDEGDAGGQAASSVPGVVKVVKVFQYVQPVEAQALEASAAASANAPGASAAPGSAGSSEATVGAVPVAAVSSQPLDQQAPAAGANSNGPGQGANSKAMQ